MAMISITLRPLLKNAQCLFDIVQCFFQNCSAVDSFCLRVSVDFLHFAPSAICEDTFARFSRKRPFIRFDCGCEKVAHIVRYHV